MYSRIRRSFRLYLFVLNLFNIYIAIYKLVPISQIMFAIHGLQFVKTLDLKFFTFP